MSLLMLSVVVFLVMVATATPFENLANKQANKRSPGAWNYIESSPYGPSHWFESYVKCGGTKQSPINIDSNAAKVDETLKEFIFGKYDSTPAHEFSLTNNGHTIEVEIEDGDITISGGGLPSTYTLAQFHFHWGVSNNAGSEHTIDKKAYPLEIHFVHWNSGKYATIDEAKPQPDGLAVLGVLVQVGDPEMVSEHLSELISHIGEVASPGTVVHVEAFPIMSLLPSVKTYYRYEGSLTTPPCYESVTWTVFEQPIVITQDQMDVFRKIYTEGNHLLDFNYRPIQAINKRVVYKSVSK